MSKKRSRDENEEEEEDVKVDLEELSKKVKDKKKKKSSKKDEAEKVKEEDVEEEEIKEGENEKNKKQKTKEESSEPKVEKKVEEGDYQVYIEGLPYSMDEDSITNLFSKCGKIVSFNLPRWHDSNKIRGYAHVGYATTAERDAAIAKFDGYETGGRYLAVQMARGKNASHSSLKQPGKKLVTPPSGCNTLFVKNLPYDTTELAVKDLFNKYGNVESVRLAKWKHTQNLKGFGYVSFQSEKDLSDAINKNQNKGFILEGRRLIIDFEENKGKEEKNA